MKRNVKFVLWVGALLVLSVVCVNYWFQTCPNTNTGLSPASLVDGDDGGEEEEEVGGGEEEPGIGDKVIRSRLQAIQDDAAPAPGAALSELTCMINDEYPVQCWQDKQEVYLPFNAFLKTYFDVSGSLVEEGGVSRFDWHHAYAKVYQPTQPYKPDGVFMTFEHYNVEVRDRVKCISGMEGVPISTQWGPEGYFYPIQIAQYGLSHYSKYLNMDTHLSKVVIEDGEDPGESSWLKPELGVSLSYVHVEDHSRNTHVIEFTAPESLSGPGAVLHVTSAGNYFLSLDFRFTNNGSITVELEPKGKQPQPSYYLHYVCSTTLIIADGYHIYYGIGDHRSWGRIYRDLNTDLMKGLKLKKKIKEKKNIHRVLNIVLRGHGWVDNVTLSNNAHLAQFYSAANWLLSNQAENGGWPIQVTRSLADGLLTLPPGWVSAMGQGQAISLLVRAYYRTGRDKYLECAVQALNVFHIPSSEGGVLAKFMGRHDWYEEYPTTPSSYVLNGFIYSLIGLYDLALVAPKGQREMAHRLYRAGLNSLIAMLPFFDTGSGSIYDLRHYSLHVAPNLARWDYHATHINQLLLLATIDDDPIFETTAKRWIGYMKGHRAPHN